jgi:hydrogenase maturation protease
MTTKPTVVIGLGNPLMADDGIGLALLARLRELWRFDPEPRWLDGGTWGMNLLPDIEEAGRVLFLDAIHTGAAPGTPTRLDRDRLPRWLGIKLSPHQIDLKEVLALAELRGTMPEHAVAVGLQPEKMEMDLALSPAVGARLDEAVGLAVDTLGAWGHRPAEAPCTS